MTSSDPRNPPTAGDSGTETGVVIGPLRSTPENAALLADLAERLFRETYAPDHDSPDVEIYVRTAFGRNRQQAELAQPGAVTLLVRSPEQDAPLGYVQLRPAPLPAEAAAHTGVYGPAMEISRFYVDRRWHGRGVAQQLMAACIGDAERRHARAVWLAVWEHNHRAIAFYERQGFRQAGMQPFQFGNSPELDPVMVRVLRDATAPLAHTRPTAARTRRSRRRSE